MKARTRLLAAIAAGLLGSASLPGATAARSELSTPNLEHVNSIPYTGGADLEFQTRTEQVTRNVTTTRISRTRTVSCTRRGIVCRRGQRFKTIRVRPYRQAVTTQVTETVTKHYMYASSSAGFSGGNPTGLRIIDITEAAKPVITDFFACHTNQNDIQIVERGAKTYVLLGLDSASTQKLESDCFPQLGIPTSSRGLVVVDVTNVYAPRAVGFVPLLFGVHNSTVHPSGRYVYVSDSELLRNGFQEHDPTYSPGKVQVIDLVDPLHPVFLREVDLPPGMSSHDITFNSDGSRAYAASLSQTVILDSSNPSYPKVITTIEDPAINIHHQADPYTIDGRTYLIITDEQAGAGGNFNCPGGGLHIYDITNELIPVKLGVFVIPDVSFVLQDGRWRCTSHVLRIYPNEGILTIAWYNAGIWVIDISDPMNFEAVGYANPTLLDGRIADTWSAKMHNGYLYTNDLGRGIDVYRYLGKAPPMQVTETIQSMQTAYSASTVKFDPPTADSNLLCFEIGQLG